MSVPQHWQLQDLKKKKKQNNISWDKLNGRRSWGVRGWNAYHIQKGLGVDKTMLSHYFLGKNINWIIYAKNYH